MTTRLFRDRRDAGRVLAEQLRRYRGRQDLLVLALPRGGVPVAYEVAVALAAPLDVLVVRKLGVPGRPEVAMGALASGGVLVLNEDVVRGLGIEPDAVEQVAEREGAELLRREQLFREGRPEPGVAGKLVVLVDDGLATGSSMTAALQALQSMDPAGVVVAVPAAPASTCRELARLVDDMVCATTPSPFTAVGESYWDFTQTSDDEVRALLRSAAGPRLSAVGPATSDAVALRDAAVPTNGGVPQDQVLVELVGDARYVLLGEASHGTQEFYEARAGMTRRLIEQLGFSAVAVEADWPDAYRVNRWVRGRSDDPDAEEALRGFERFPTWMWRNAPVLEFAGWLRQHNDALPDGPARAGFYGLDLYSLHRSAHDVIAYLDTIDPEAAARARERYSCFDHHDRSDDGQAYGRAAAFGAGESCQRQAVEQLAELQQRALSYGENEWLPEDEQFAARMNARVVKDAEEYYRSMFGGLVSTWNLRDQHMVHTLESLSAHLSQQRGEPARVVVWAHNSHLGDARATEMGMRGELNVGQLVRERHPLASRSVGFTTSAGTVTAADDWGGPAQRKRVRDPLPGSVEALFHDVGWDDFLLLPRRAARAREVLASARLERAIGVIYRPQTERQSHYFRARVADQFDAVIHVDRTRAVEPLERTGRWEQGELPDTYPFAV